MNNRPTDAHDLHEALAVRAVRSVPTSRSGDQSVDQAETVVAEPADGHSPASLEDDTSEMGQLEEA